MMSVAAPHLLHEPAHDHAAQEELMRKLEFIAVLAGLAIATPALAQGRGRGNGGVPPGQRPAAGMCRVWIDGLPPGQQPAPTDCGTAAARVPYNGRIIYGDQTNESRRRVYDSNGQIYTNGQNCVRRADRDGRIQTICSDGDHDRDDRVSSRVYGAQSPIYRNQNPVYGNQSRVYQDQNRIYRDENRVVNGNGKVKHRKHKGDRDGDRDEDRNRN
jgi:hypothetical protein